MGGIKDIGFGFDIPMSISDALKTTTADFTPVCLNPSNASDNTVHGVEEEGTDELHAFGMLLSGLSANSSQVPVRVLGKAKAYAGAAIAVGQPVYPAGSSLGTTDVGGTVLPFDAANAGGATNTAKILGYALEAAAATGDALTIFVNPQLAYVTA